MHTKICPECGDDIPVRYKAHKCGWRETPERKEKKPLDPLQGLCEHIRAGERCSRPGAISPGMHGGGPWFCWLHYADVVMDRPGVSVAAGLPDDPALDMQVHREYPKEANPPYRYWARRILRLETLGRPMNATAVGMAREALGLSPGDDFLAICPRVAERYAPAREPA